jgi:SNF2 family DNA or RNA helicase
MQAYHKEFGLGTIINQDNDTILVEFQNNNFQRCSKDTLEFRETPVEKAIGRKFGDFDKSMARVEASLINEINDSWGLFSISTVDLLPHQLWVCNTILKKWPIRHLIADDVGLGKTIEGGLILWPILASGKVKRLLILTPASLVKQWEQRLWNMFKIPLQRYSTDQDNPGGNFWETHNHVVASYYTLQADKNDRHDRLFSSPSWDLVIVDEAHHLNADEKNGKTLAYQLLEKLENYGKAPSRLLFTGTPHRGKEFGFFSLMKLVEPEIFDPRKDKDNQYKELHNYLIRNNKQNATSMNGELLFKPIVQHPEIFHYSEEETEFYNTLTEFISSGKAYASTLEGEKNNQVILVLIALQKIASSSIAAIKSALETRKARFEKKEAELRAGQDEILSESYEDDDSMIALKKYLSENSPLKLMENEIQYINRLITLAEKVKEESRIKRICAIIKEKFPEDQVLFFTEYKRTQAAMINALNKEYAAGKTGFINGDNLLLLGYDDNKRKIELKKAREDSANDFNQGKIRFLVSTEAAGEGIDLQEKCHVLIHIDLPWNPMRLHQRAGRLNRYGQTRPVDIISLRNPDTIESMIWEKLEEKLRSIRAVFTAVQEDPEDLFQLVLGAEDPNFYDKLFFDGASIKDKENLSKWFNSETQTFGGVDTIKVINNLLGNASKFNLSGLKGVPRLDLPDLESFFIRSIKLANRRITQEADKSFSFLTPDEWKEDYGIKEKYEKLIFKRKLEPQKNDMNICGIGHIMFTKALETSLKYEDNVTLITSDASYFVYRIFDKITVHETIIKNHYLIAKYVNNNDITWYSSVDFFPLLKNLKSMTPKDEMETDIHNIIKNIEGQLLQKIDIFKAEYELPGFELFAIFLGKGVTASVL